MNWKGCDRKLSWHRLMHYTGNYAEEMKGTEKYWSLGEGLNPPFPQHGVWVPPTQPLRSVGRFPETFLKGRLSRKERMHDITCKRGGRASAHNHHCHHYHRTFRGRDTWSLHLPVRLLIMACRNSSSPRTVNVRSLKSTWFPPNIARILFSVLRTRNSFPCDTGRDSCGCSPSGFCTLFLETALPCLLFANAFFPVPSALCGFYIPTARSDVPNLWILPT
jgi:hypothetical protein